MTVRHSTIPGLVLLAIVAAGCSMTATGSPSAGAPARGSSPSTSAGTSRSAEVRRQLPDAFPVMPGAVSVPLSQDDPGLIARWESDRLGAAAYDFYVVALPAAGYPLVGLYPGGDFAVIRFLVPEGEVWQMVARSTEDGRVAIEIRVDRP
ncbi:MAG: hypothetical protein WD402_08415 [Chloroflexota bacterium]